MPSWNTPSLSSDLVNQMKQYSTRLRVKTEQSYKAERHVDRLNRDCYKAIQIKRCSLILWFHQLLQSSYLVRS